MMIKNNDYGYDNDNDNDNETQDNLAEFLEESKDSANRKIKPDKALDELNKFR